MKYNTLIKIKATISYRSITNDFLYIKLQITILHHNTVLIKVKVKFSLEQATKVQRGSRCIALLFLQARCQMGVGGQCHALATLPRERPGTHCIGGWVGPRAGLAWCRKLHHHRDSIPGPSSPQRVTIPSELSWPYNTVSPLQFPTSCNILITIA